MTTFHAALREARISPALCSSIAGFTSPLAALAQDVARQLEADLVTARKGEEKLNDVPVAIMAITVGALARSNVASLADVAAFEPGSSFEACNSGTTPASSIRGPSQTAPKSWRKRPVAHAEHPGSHGGCG